MAKAKLDRNKKIVAYRDDPVNKHSFRSIASIFQLAESTVREIYYREKSSNKEDSK